MNKLFQIGDFCFRLLCPDELPIPQNFLLFESRAGTPEHTYQIQIVDRLPTPDGKIIATRPDLIVYSSPAGEGRMIGVKGQDKFYASCQEVSECRTTVYLSADRIERLNIDPVFTSLFSMERQMIKRDSLILHCAYIAHRGKAILFSAPSETGKSTQAALWERYRGSRTVNGDRGLLRKAGGIWTACGWPVCGSSGQCFQGDMPIHAIVMLRQGKENEAVRLSPIQAFSQLYAQITINQWNTDFVQQAMTLIEELVMQIPVYQLTCDISENAVRALEQALYPRED